MSKNIEVSRYDIFSDVRYICRSNVLIRDALRRGCDVAQLTTGEVLVTEVKIVNTCYKWNREEKQMEKLYVR